VKWDIAFKILAGAFTSAVMVACVFPGTFKDSTAGKVARVKIVMPERTNIFTIFRNGLDCTEGEILDRQTTASIIAGTAPPIVIEAEKEFAVYADLRHWGFPLRYCDLAISFFPEPDGHYRMRLYRSEDGCGIEVKRLVKEGDTTREIAEPSFKRRYMVAGVTAPYCYRTE
jgi:hypothetical protein